MANRKRLPGDDAADPLPPRTSARHATNVVAIPGDDDSSGPSETVTPRLDDDDTHGPSKTGLSGPALIQEVMKMVENKDSVELMILE